jgi:hypothetical protein
VDDGVWFVVDGRGELTFGFGDAEDRVYDHDNAGGAEDEESAVGDLGEHNGCELGGGLVAVLY